MRAEKLEEWRQVTACHDFNFMRFMCSESELLKYKSEGLPGDELSMENAIMILNTVKQPLIIDPTTAATEWLKTSLASNGSVEVLNQ